MTVEEVSGLLEEELRAAVEVKNDKALHRYIMLLSTNIVSKQTHTEETRGIEGKLTELSTDMRIGFERMDTRFEKMDQRFESMQKQIDERFAAVDRRFDDMNNRFEDINKRFDDVNRRFEDMNSRFDDNSKKFTMMFTFITLGFLMLGTMTSLFHFFS